MINVGGYKVNPHEVENEIKRQKGVIDVLVKARNNRITGSILTAEVEVMEGINKKEKEKRDNKGIRKKFTKLENSQNNNFC